MLGGIKEETMAGSKTNDHKATRPKLHRIFLIQTHLDHRLGEELDQIAMQVSKFVSFCIYILIDSTERLKTMFIKELLSTPHNSMYLRI